MLARDSLSRLGRVLHAPLVLALPALLVQLAPGAAERLEYDRDRLAAGELWRLATCHFTHWSPEHLFWDLGAVVLLAACCSRFGMQRLTAALCSADLAVSLAVWIALPSMSRYRGLSGLASALFALLAVSVWREAREGGRPALAFAAAAALVGFVIKLSWEMATTSPVFVGPGSGFVAVPLAHLVGAVCGGCCAPGQSPMISFSPSMTAWTSSGARRPRKPPRRSAARVRIWLILTHDLFGKNADRTSSDKG
jgi:rhomboid family GlyGly-CTERM serine protease